MHPRSKKPRLVHAPPPRRSRRLAGRLKATFDDLGVDELAHIFGFLGPFEIMRARLNKKMRDSAKQTIVHNTLFVVDSVRKYNALVAMSTALPNLQQISLHDLGGGHKYIDGDDAEEERSVTDNITTHHHDINIISSFRKLRVLLIHQEAPLNGRYPVLFNFPLLQELMICRQRHLKFDLDMLAGGPMLEVLLCSTNESMTGNLRSFRVLKDCLTKVRLWDCEKVQGNLMDLADFPRLKVLDLKLIAITGDIWKISERDFLATEELNLPQRIYGGTETYEFQLIADAADAIKAFYPITKQRPVLMKHWIGRLSHLSPDNYSGWFDMAPKYVKFIQAGSRVGYHWFALNDGTFACEAIWLDPEPDRGSSDYEKYIEELQEIENEVDLFAGFQQPPNEVEYHRRCAERGYYR